jgi:CRP-like cAMP-binding protein
MVMEELLVSKIPLFASLSPVEKNQVVDMLHLREIPPGTTLLHEGDTGFCFYFVLEGQVEIVKAMGTPDERLLGVRGAGEYLGEMSLFNPEGLRTASVRTTGQVVLLEMSHNDFDLVLHRFPPWCMNCCG